MTRHLIAPLVAGAAALLLAGPLGLADRAAAQERTLNIYNWSDYIAEDTIEKFEAETGISVNYDVFDSNEVLEGKLLAGNTGYDIVVPSGAFLERQIQAGVFAELDKSKLENYGNLDPVVLDKVSQHDPENKHAIPYMWGTTGIGYNANMVKKIMPDAPVYSWDLIFDPEIVSKFADCGVTLLDAPSEVFEIALNYLGKDPHTADPDDYAEAEALINKIRPYIKYFHSSQNINDLANGDICIAMGWSGDMLIARDRAAEADNGVNVIYSIPREGTVIWFDLMAIPNDANNVDAAHEFLDFIMRPQIIADITNYVFYPNGNKEADPFILDEVKTDPSIYPPASTRERLFADKAATLRLDRMRTRAWTRIKTGT